MSPRSNHGSTNAKIASLFLTFLLAASMVLLGGAGAAAAVTQTWYLPEGSTAWGFSTYITLENPNTVPGNATITYMTLAGVVPGPTVYLPGQSELTVFPSDTVGAQDFSTMVTSDLEYPIAVDRTMYWPSGYADGLGYHSSIGVLATPASPLPTLWYLPEGSSAWDFECWLLIQNPNASTANCNVTYMIEGGSPVVKSHAIPANSRQSFSMKSEIGTRDASIMVESTDVPVVCERSMYKPGPGAAAGNRREGHVSIGTPTAANDYYLAEGSTGYGFTTYILVQNPNGSPTNVVLTYNTPSGSVSDPPVSIPANSRKTVRVNDSHPNMDLSTHVIADQPVIAERSMYWTPSAASGQAMHDSIGMAEGHASFYLPDGEVYANASTGDLIETYTLVQNPNNSEVRVAVSYFTADGGLFAWTETIPANSRRTYNMADRIAPNNRAAIKVECRTSGKKIMCERSMYFERRMGGTATIGGISD